MLRYIRGFSILLNVPTGPFFFLIRNANNREGHKNIGISFALRTEVAEQLLKTFKLLADTNKKFKKSSPLSCFL